MDRVNFKQIGHALILLSALQQFQVVATENVNPAALGSDIHCAAATEKIDGTCCYVTTFNGTS